MNHFQDPRSFNNNQIDTKAKRPFCNAFTGCGRKRSNEVAPPPPVQVFDDEEASVSELLELNSEPAIENLMRQIMSEAKMYEAIQEANREMFLQKLKHANGINRSAPSAYSLQ
jgi:Arthropod cardioacceleratory peptide 2a